MDKLYEKKENKRERERALRERNGEREQEKVFQCVGGEGERERVCPVWVMLKG